MTQRHVIPQLIASIINANGQSVSAFVENYSTVAVSMATAALSGHTVAFEVSNDAKINPDTGRWDGTSGTWYGVLGQRTNAVTQETGGTTLAATPAYGWIVPVVGFRFFRVRATAHTSGSATWILLPDDDPAALAPNNGSVTVGALPAGTNLIGDVGAQVRATSGGLASISRLLSAAASTNATVVKGSAGRAYKIRGYNAAAAVRYLKLYNKATAPTVGTDTPVATIALKPSDAFDIDFGLLGEYFSSGIGYALTTGAPDADTGALTAADVLGMNIWYA